MVAWIIEFIVLVLIFVVFGLMGDTISHFSNQKDRYKAIRWLTFVVFLFGEFWQVIIEHFK